MDRRGGWGGRERRERVIDREGRQKEMSRNDTLKVPTRRSTLSASTKRLGPGSPVKFDERHYLIWTVLTIFFIFFCFIHKSILPDLIYWKSSPSQDVVEYER